MKYKILTIGSILILICSAFVVSANLEVKEEEPSYDYATIKTQMVVGTSNETRGIGYKTYLIARVFGHVSRVNLNDHSLLGYADNLRIKPLGRRAFYIGNDQDGSNCFYSPRFFGTVKDGFISGIAFSLRVGDWYYKPKCYDELVDWYKTLESI